ncbi:MAG: glycogen synthase, partial [Gammaproteobacteria bacterium]
MSLRILFVASEMAPLMKVGGLADVIQGLPAALDALGHDVRVLMPAYADVRAPARVLVKTYQASAACAGTSLFEVRSADSPVPVWLIDGPGFGDRPGNPYVDRKGQPYPDNAARFNRLCEVASAIAGNACGLDWQPNVVHCHDWHAGLTPVWMRLNQVPAASVFTIHNLGYQGLFPRDMFAVLKLPERLWHYQSLEFHGQLSFMKGGLVFSDRLTTVSPNYAGEILTDSYGCGLQGVLSERAADLTGILNGIDATYWNPETDTWLAHTYS